MPDVNPNRVLAGRRGAGQFTHKVNNEQDVDLVDDEIANVSVSPERDTTVDILVRSESLNNEIMDEIRKNPSVDRHIELLRENMDTIGEVMERRQKAGGTSQADDRYPIPGYKNVIDHMNQQYKDEATKKPYDIGGVRVRIVSDDEDQTVEVTPDKFPGQGMDVDVSRLVRKASQTLRPDRDYNMDRRLQDVMRSAGRNHRAAQVGFAVNKATGKREVNYIVVETIPSRQSEFINDHGGAKPIADGWL